MTEVIAARQLLPSLDSDTARSGRCTPAGSRCRAASRRHVTLTLPVELAPAASAGTLAAVVQRAIRRALHRIGREEVRGHRGPAPVPPWFLTVSVTVK
jgi:hypothetical protein